MIVGRDRQPLWRKQEMTRDEAIAQLAKYWHYHTIDIWRRARYQCEYCGKRLITNSDDYLFDAHLDHVVPGVGNDFDNYALSCKACNYIKRAVDYRVTEGPNTREALIVRAAKSIALTRERNKGAARGRFKAA
jgi:5-methylcytosine-specific restriction endonuclease McrA